MKLKTFSRRSLLAAIMLLLFIANSCKKDALIKDAGTGVGNVVAANTAYAINSTKVEPKDIAK